MDPSQVPPPPAAPAAPVPPAVPQYTPPAAAAPPPAAPDQMAQGGILKQFNWLEIGILTLGVFCCFCVVSYYRKKQKTEDRNLASIEDLKAENEKLTMEFAGFKRMMTRRTS